MTIEASLYRAPVAEGKTKKLFELVSDPTKVILVSKDDITAGDGAKHDVIEGKAKLANQTTCNVFRLLQACGIPVAFDEQLGPLPSGAITHGFVAPKCEMLPYEVVVRREAHGSYLKRAPHLKKGHIFPRLVLEFFLKTSGRKWKEHELVCDDPLMSFAREGDRKMVLLYDPKLPDLVNAPAANFLSLEQNEILGYEDEKYFQQIGDIARQTFLVLEKAWQLQGKKLVDFKVEFGLDADRKLLLADVIDNDSWRVVDGAGNYIDKQVYRDGGDLNVVTKKYQQVAELTGQFTLPRQRLLLWRGSESDDLKSLGEPISKLALKPTFEVFPVTCSAHKQPALAYRLLQQHITEVPDTVIVALIGMSNGAGPTLAANTTVPVITVPATYKEFPEDVWSSLRTPSNVPVMTVLDPKNATIAALQILAMRNPGLYASLRFEQEKRLTDI